MPVFQYRALQADGTIAVGEIEAGGRQEAFRQMEGQGLRPIRLAQRNGDSHKSSPKKPSTETAQQSREEKSSGLNLSLGNSTRISGRMLENFTRLLSSLLAA